MSRRSRAADLGLALVFTALVHALLGFVFTVAKGAADYGEAKPKDKRRFGHGPVAFERRKPEQECSSIPECSKDLEPITVTLKIATLGQKEPDPKKLPEIQKFETPEKVETGVNVDKEPVEAKAKPLQDFLRKKAELDRRRKQQERQLKNLFNLDDDPRARPTRLEDKFGLEKGDIHGQGFEQTELDTYFARLSRELHLRFHVPTTLTCNQLRQQRVHVILRRMSSDGAIVEYQIKQRAQHKGFTLAAEAALKQFMPKEGGQHRVPPPPRELLETINRKGILVLLDGALFQC